MSICDFMREFDSKYFKMKEKKMELPDEVLAFRLVKNCRLTEVQRDQVMASTKPLSFKEVRATLKRMFESSGGDGQLSHSHESGSQSVRIKEEPLYMARGENSEGYNTRGDSMKEKCEEGVWCLQIIGIPEDMVDIEDLLGMEDILVDMKGEVDMIEGVLSVDLRSTG